MVPRVAPRCAWQVVEGEAVLLDVHGRRIMGLNPVGSFVFGRVDGARSVGDISGEVAARFGVAPERASADVAATRTNADATMDDFMKCAVER